MKKLTKMMIGVTLILCMIFATCQITYAKDTPTTIGLVAGRFNSCTRVVNYNNAHAEDSNKLYLNATNTESSLTVEVQENGITNLLEYHYNPSTYILTGEYPGGNDTIKGYWREVTNIIIDCIGQINNRFGEGYLYNTLSSSEMVDYKLSENGFHITDNPNSTVYLAEININKEITLPDLDKYIKEEHLSDQKEKIQGDESAEKKVGNAIFYKYTIDNLDYIIIGEKGGFSYVANNSLKSALNVFFDHGAEVNYFYDNYSDINAEGNKRFDGFKVEKNPIMNEKEEEKLGSDGSYQFIRVTIDRDAAKEAAQTQSRSGNSSEGGADSNSGLGSGSSTSPNSDTLPKTGGEINAPLLVLYGIMGAAGIGIIILTANSKKEK